LGVASFLVNYFSQVPFPDTYGCAPLPGCTSKVPLLSAETELAVYPQHPALLILPSSFSTARVSAFVSAIMAPRLNAA